jgi:hypothetical protein
LFYELLCKSDAGKKGIDWYIYRIDWFVDRCVDVDRLSLELRLVLVCLVCSSESSTPMESIFRYHLALMQEARARTEAWHRYQKRNT